MTNPEHIEQLKKGVSSWNEWSDKYLYLSTEIAPGHVIKTPKIPINMEGADLTSINLTGLTLHRANLKDSRLFNSKLQEVDFSGSNMENADLRKAQLTSSKLISVNLKNADLCSADLESADLSSSNLEGAMLFRANLEGSNLLFTKNVRLNHTRTKGALFSNKSNDPWSVLRRTYTGPKLIFHLLTLIAFSIPLVAKTLFWASVNIGQNYTHDLLDSVKSRALDLQMDEQMIALLGLSPDKLLSLSQCLSEFCRQRSVWELLLGIDQNNGFWILPLTLIAYNGLRGILTFIVAPMRDEEERTGFSPVWIGSGLMRKNEEPKLYELYRKVWWQGYRWLFYFHTLAFWLGFIAGAAFLYNSWYWLTKPIYLPM